MNEIKIRPATFDDLSQLYDFEQKIIETERAFDPTLKKERTNYYDLREMITAPDVELVVAELNNTLIGSGYARIEKSKLYLAHTQHAYLGFMYVLPEHRGKGINRRVIETLKNWAYSRSIKELRLEVYHNNLAAISAYEKIGFTKHIIEMRFHPDEHR